MEKRGGYCGLINKADGLYLCIYAGDSGGSSIKFEDIDEYLNKKRITYDKSLIISAIMGSTERKEIKLSANPLPYPEDEFLIAKIADNKLSATGKFYPPMQGGKLLSKEDIKDRLMNAGVKFGFSDIEISSFLDDRQYCKEYTLAEAKMPIEGKNAAITYYFNTDLSKKPQTNEDGSVDFHKLDNISSVKKDALLAKLDQAIEGTPGTDVSGSVLRPMKVERKILRHGNKIHLADEGTKMYSEVDGHVTLIDNKVFVSDTYEIAADVGPSTGDVIYEGNVVVKGNVNNGYSITAHGNISVDGVVEGANLIADGHIILKSGIQGANKGVLKANGNITAKFIESAEVICGGYVQAEAILHSKVSARGDVIVGGKKGYIVGGEIRSLTMINVKKAGNTMGTRTLLEVGVDPAIMDEYKALEKLIPDTEREIEKITQSLMIYAKKVKNGESLDERILAGVKAGITYKKNLLDKLDDAKQQYIRLQEGIEQNTSGCIKVMDTIHPGCKITISNVGLFIKSDVQHTKFIKDGADIKTMLV